MESEETETWQELLQESFEGNHLQLISLTSRWRDLE
jgi:hypothetical protein